MEVELVTGRTHQIRAHLANAGYPIIGDEKYGDRRVNAKIKQRFAQTTQLLHAYRLCFSEGVAPLDSLSGKTIECIPPQGFRNILTELFGDDAIRETR